MRFQSSFAKLVATTRRSIPPGGRPRFDEGDRAGPLPGWLTGLEETVSWGLDRRLARRRFGQLVGQSLLIALAPACTLVTTPTSPFVAEPRGLLYADGRQIWRVDPANPAAPHQILFSAPSQAHVGDPAWAPDGNQFACSVTYLPGADGGYGSDIIMAATDQSRQATLVRRDRDGTFNYEPVWSPDGQALFYSSATTVHARDQGPPERRQSLLRLNLTNGQSEVIAENAHHAALSSDGRWVAFLRYPAVSQMPQAGGLRPALWLARADGSEARPLEASAAFLTLGQPRFLPGAPTLILPAGGGPERPARLAPVLPQMTSFDWTPRVAAHGYPMDLWSIELETGQCERLVALGADDPAVACSPDGQRLACVTADLFFTLDLTTASITVLSTAGEAVGPLDW